MDHQEKKLFYNVQLFIYNAQQILIQVVNSFRKWVVNHVGISTKQNIWRFQMDETVPKNEGAVVGGKRGSVSAEFPIMQTASISKWPNPDLR